MSRSWNPHHFVDASKMVRTNVSGRHHIAAGAGAVAGPGVAWGMGPGIAGPVGYCP
jgi:hypothetical protein